MIQVKRLVVGQLKTNCYLVKEEKSKKTIIIDPGDDAEYITNIINEEKIKPIMILATHGHFDHILASLPLKLIYKIPLLIHKDDEFLLKRLGSSANYFLGVNDSLNTGIDRYVRKGDKIVLSKETFEIIETPGHTPGSISIINKKEKIIFVGDLVFSEGGVGRTDFSYGSNNILSKSIKKILKLSNDTKVYSGHGEETTVKDIKK